MQNPVLRNGVNKMRFQLIDWFILLVEETNWPIQQRSMMVFIQPSPVT